MKRMKKTVMTLVVISMLLSGLAGNGLAAGAKKKAKKVRLNKTKVTLSVGKTTRLRVKGAKKQKIKWSSTDKRVAYVSRKGLVRGRKAGKAKIVAKVGKKKYKCTVKVIKKGSSSKVKWSAVTEKYKNLSDYVMANGTEEDGTVIVSKKSVNEGVTTLLRIVYDPDDEGIVFSEALTEEDGEGYVISMSISQTEPDLASLDCQITREGITYSGAAEVDTEYYSEEEDTAGFDFSGSASDENETDGEALEEDQELDEEALDDLDIEASAYFNSAMSDWNDYLAEIGCGVTLESLGFISFEF